MGLPQLHAGLVFRLAHEPRSCRPGAPRPKADAGRVQCPTERETSGLPQAFQLFFGVLLTRPGCPEQEQRNEKYQPDQALRPQLSADYQRKSSVR